MIALFLTAGGSAPGQTPSRGGGQPSAGAVIFGQPAGAPLFRAQCGSCHTQQGLEIGGRAAPSFSSLKAMSPEKIYEALGKGGKMQEQAAALTDRDKRNVIEFLTGHRVGDETASQSKMTNPCESNPPLSARVDATPAWNGWSPEITNTRFQTAALAGMQASDIPRLKLKWAFGLPGGGTASSQPTVAFGRVFVGSDNAGVYSFNAKSGCFYWSFIADSPGRFAPAIGPISGQPGSRYAVYFPTGSGMTYALDAQNGKLLWKSQIDGLLHISNSAALYDGKLFVPIAGTETMSGANPNYECCRSRGGLAALDANTGKILWKVDSIPEPLKQLGENPKGKQLWGPSGASVWNTPTIDAKRKLVYVGTGNSYGPVAAETSDSILAFNIADGKLVWSHQEFHGDSFMVGCGPSNPAGGNCPTKLGPDWDFGGSSAILERLPDGKDVLLAAGKGGVAIALDPDDNGKLLWRTQLWERTPPSPMGLVLFGGTADGKRVYYPLQQPGGGLKALDIENGKTVWNAEIKADQRGQPGAATSIPGVVFTGGWDGILRAVGTAGADDGKVIWSFDTHRDFDTINGIRANGGSLGPPGATIAGGMIYLSSGYIGVQNGFPGNVVLAFGLD
ncbi:MAG TPA: PQQ-binding-like beta-propeller repeat protein [Bryobacteraceae bacterium]